MTISTLAEGLSDKVHAARDNLLTRLSVRSGRIITTHTALPAPVLPPVELFDRCAGGVYRGG